MASHQNRYRTKLCRNFALGYCAQGNQCKYLHPVVLPVLGYPTLKSQAATANAPLLSLATSSSVLTGQWLAMDASAQSQAELNAWNERANQYNAPAPAIPPFAPQYKPLSWRTALCRHFTKNRGWCPLGDDCNYIHDLELADIALEDVRFPSRRITIGSAVDSSHGNAATKHSHCWAYVQGLCHVRDCPYLHPVAVHRFIRHTPCLAWPNCMKGVLCPYKHPEPIIPKVPSFPFSLGSSPSAKPPSPTEPSFSGAVQYHGTTYFPLQPPAPQSPARTAQVAQSRGPQAAVPISSNYAQTVGSPPWQNVLSPISPLLHPAPSYGVQSTHGHPMNSSTWLRLLSPVVPQAQPPNYAFEAQRPHNAMGVNPRRRSARSPEYQEHLIYAAEPSAVSAQPRRVSAREDSVPRTGVVYQAIMQSVPKQSTGDEEFPYAPPKAQRAGHARRVSVALKSKDDSDALGLVAEGSARESWKTHGNRQTHKSWAPSTSSMNLV